VMTSFRWSSTASLHFFLPHVSPENRGSRQANLDALERNRTKHH
jgi:hypothetical protein